MKRALAVAALSIAGLVPLWRYDPSAGSAGTVVAEPAPAVAAPDTSGGAAAGGSSDGSAAPAATHRVVAGSTVDTEHGDVQVEVTFQGDRITSVRMLKQPNSGPTKKAVPQLVEETLQAQSAQVDTVSGATMTSEAYAESLQAALDAKGA
ncbi:MAG: FMN-binding protein [Streptomycetaceae bacterium]|nr:FMN-binding protein [Streptomycetaceae bacterium]